MKSNRNKTLSLSEEETRLALGRCVPLCGLKGNENAIVNADFFDAAKFMEQGSVDLLIVDPPYNLTKNYGGKVFKAMGAREYADFTCRWIEACLPLLKPTASVYVCCDYLSGIAIAPVLCEYFDVRSRITWEREKGRGALKNWKNSLEDVWFCTVSDDYTFNRDAVKIRRKVIAPYRENGAAKDWEEADGVKFRDTCPSNFWGDITVPYWSMPENTAHPTQKPEKLIAKLVLASSNAGDLVFDPFAGSGTTAVVAKKLGRRFVAVEQNPDYCALAIARLDRAGSDKRIQGFDGVRFYERNYK